MTPSALSTEVVDDVSHLVSRWQHRLGLAGWQGSLERISDMQVCDDDGLPGQELVGVVTEGGCFTIVHTRDIDEHDVIHELLHVAYPDWPHTRIEICTDLLFTGVVTPREIQTNVRSD